MMPKGTQGATDRPYNLIQKAEHISCPLYLAVRVGEGRQLIIIKLLLRLKSQAKKRKVFQFSFFLVEQLEKILKLNSNSISLLTKVALWRAQYDESCKLCSGGSYCLSLASMVELVGEA